MNAEKLFTKIYKKGISENKVTKFIGNYISANIKEKYKGNTLYLTPPTNIRLLKAIEDKFLNV